MNKEEIRERFLKDNPNYGAETDNFSLKRRVRSNTLWHVKQGNIKKKPCEVCGSENSEVHHVTYTPPVQIKFLCSKCHGAEHTKIFKKTNVKLDLQKIVYIPKEYKNKPAEWTKYSKDKKTKRVFI